MSEVTGVDLLVVVAHLVVPGVERRRKREPHLPVGLCYLFYIISGFISWAPMTLLSDLSATCQRGPQGKPLKPSKAQAARDGQATLSMSPSRGSRG